ncbi:MAG: hypothetical protein J7L55_01120, partial [Desulfurococcales archaeon]|nr:hypothetical protein [Desulfurococcales archaeon]
MSFPYSKARKGQLEVINVIRESLGRKIFLKAPTGFGKTIVAVSSHMGEGLTMYAVRTRNEMAPVIRELRRVKANFTIVFSASRMCPLAGKGVETEFWLNCRLLRSRNLCPYYARLPSVSDSDVANVLKRAETTDPHKIAELIAKELGVCPFFALTRLIQGSDFAVVTYPYVFRNEVFDTAFEDIGRGDMCLVLDEAHTVMNPQLVIDEELDEFIVEKAIREVKTYKLGSEVLKYLEGLMNVFKHVRTTLLRRIPKEEVVPDLGIQVMLRDALISLRVIKLRTAISASEVASTSSALGKVAKFLDLAASPHFRIYGAVGRDGARVLKALTPDLDYVKDVIKSFKGSLMMSGTLPSERIIKETMFEDALYIDVVREYGEVFPKENVAYVVYPSVTSSYRYRNEETYLKYAELITELVKSLERGVALIVYPSYKFMDSVTKNVVLKGVKQVVEGYGTTSEEVEGLRKHSKAVIHSVAGGKIAEGLEVLSLSGESLIKLVVIAGVPYPQPDDYIKDLRESLQRAVPADIAREFVMDVQASVKVAQALGRAIRSEKDVAFMVLADKRFLSMRLREALGIRYDGVVSDL